LQSELEAFIREEYQRSEAYASEMAADQSEMLRSLIEKYLHSWDKQGIPRPLAESDQSQVFLVWRHQLFQSFAGAGEQIDANFCEILAYVSSLDPRRFLLVCALWLKVCGFQRIRICDSPGDAGVDLFGVQRQGGLRSLVLVVQAKTSKNEIGEGLIVSEYAKFRMLPHHDRFMEYRRALDIDNSYDGMAWSYALLANQSFNWKARKASSKLGILLRSAHQMAYLLSKIHRRQEIEMEVERLEPNFRPSLTQDYSTAFDI